MQRADSLEKTRCWERLKAGREGNDGGQDGWKASLTRRTWLWASSRKWWMTRKPGMLQSTGSQSWTWLSNWTTNILDVCLMSNFSIFPLEFKLHIIKDFFFFYFCCYCYSLLHLQSLWYYLEIGMLKWVLV